MSLNIKQFLKYQNLVKAILDHFTFYCYNRKDCILSFEIMNLRSSFQQCIYNKGMTTSEIYPKSMIFYRYIIIPIVYMPTITQKFENCNNKKRLHVFVVHCGKVVVTCHLIEDEGETDIFLLKTLYSPKIHQYCTFICTCIQMLRFSQTLPSLDILGGQKIY